MLEDWENIVCIGGSVLLASHAELLCFNGINGATGEYDLPPMRGEEFFQFLRGASLPENLAELKYRQQMRRLTNLGVKAGVDPTKLHEAGWGIIFTHNVDSAIKEALHLLIRHRQEQAGDFYKELEYQPGESKQKFLIRYGVGPGPVDPEKVPYYLLLVGNPQEIDYRFQRELDVQYAVGRIYFATLEEYANYAASVVTAETKGLKLARRMTFFGASNDKDKATKLSTEHLIEPLHQKLSLDYQHWQFDTFLRQEAMKKNLSHLLNGSEPPALLFTASHGISFPSGDVRQPPHQGALLCQDWPGPIWKQPVPPDHYFSGDDLEKNANLLGLIAFFFSCYGVGTPLHDEFSKQAFKNRQQIAPYPFLAQLPTKMLSQEKGGALAVIGHVDRAWGYSFLWPSVDGPQTVVFESALRRLLEGQPVGFAVEYFNERYAELSVELANELEESEFGKRVEPYAMASMWTANNDARGYAILGDPAVRLCIADVGEANQQRPALAVQPLQEPADAKTLEKLDETVAVPLREIPITPIVSTSEGHSDVSLFTEAKTITVNTYIATDSANVQERKLLLQTQLRLDGETETTIFGNIDQPSIFALHEQVIKEAVTARLAYLKLSQAQQQIEQS